MIIEKRIQKSTSGFEYFWNERIMKRFVKANLFVFCCCAAGLLLIVYLGAFSCEVSWILEAHGDLPFSSYFLCTEFFIIFIATTILIHGLVTGLSWGLFAWSILIGLFSIPELVFVMIMTTQHWGLQSLHGLTELVSYLIRLLINCFALICVIPTGLRWRRETQVLSQLQDLATRLQLQTPPPSVPKIPINESRRSSLRLNKQGCENTNYANAQPLSLNVFENSNSLLGSQNEFNASTFSHTCMQNLNKSMLGCHANRTQSLMDLRCTLPGMYNPRYVLDTEDRNGRYFNISIEDLKNNIQDSITNRAKSTNVSGDPIYCTVESAQSIVSAEALSKSKQQKFPSKFSRNCISLENLDRSQIQNDLTFYGKNVHGQQNYLATLGSQWQPIQIERSYVPSNLPVTFGQNSYQFQFYRGFGYANYANPYITANSKLSIGNESDDYRRYRDVAL